MDLSVAEILDYTMLTALYREAELYNPEESALYDFYWRSPEVAETDAFEWIVDPLSLGVAPTSLRAVPAKLQQLHGLAKKEIEIIVSFNKIGMSLDSLRALRHPSERFLQKKGVEEVRRQVQTFAEKQRRLRFLAMAKAFTGSIFIQNSTGSIVESSGDGTRTVSTGVPSSHTGALSKATLGVSTQLGAGNIIANNWDTTDADIFSQLEELSRAAMLSGLPRPKHVWVTTEAKSWIREQSTFQEWAQVSPAIAEGVLRGDIVENLGGFTWHFWDGSYQDADGVIRTYLDPLKALITPEPGKWMAAAEGISIVPTDLNVGQSAEDRLNSSQEIQGEFSYAKIKDDPMELMVYYGDAFVPAFRQPEVVWYPTVAS